MPKSSYDCKYQIFGSAKIVGSTHANMKEIRVRFGKQVWRFAFDPTQSAITLCGGYTQGMSQTLFYKTLIRKTDSRFSA
jgi:hypothetical protein